MRLLVTVTAFGLAIFASAAPARAQSVSLSVERQDDIYAGVPFVLAAAAEGFDDAPEPTASDPAIDGATVVPLGVSRSESTYVQSINGRVTQQRQVTFVFRWRVVPSKAGRYQVPAITVTQDGTKAASRPAAFQAREIASTRDMRVRMDVPDRPVWVGETVEVGIDWYLNKDPKDPYFSVPLFDLAADGAVEVDAPAIGQRQPTLPFTVLDEQLELPYARDRAALGGVTYARFRFTAEVTPLEAGTHDLDPIAVVARLETGVGRDGFGFRVPRYSTFKAEGEPQRFVVKPLPLQGRPSSFAGAVGASYSLEVQASRTVVRVGEPIELSLIVRGSRLEGLSLPPLDSALDPDVFEIVDETAAGELIDGGDAKLFKATVTLRSKDTTAIPAIPFSYFDPEKGEYVTATSDEVALKVDDAVQVGAGAVVSGSTRGDAASVDPTDVSRTAADLSLSGRGETLDAPWTTGDVAPVVLGLYLIPLLILGVCVVRDATRDVRGESSALRRAVRAVEDAAARAGREPARESAAPLVAALRALARHVDVDVDTAVVDDLETAAYDPRAAEEPLPAALRERATDAARAWAEAHRKPGKRGGGTTAAALVLVAAGTLLGPGASRADSSAGVSTRDRLEEARGLYEAALDQGDRETRRAQFARAAAIYRELVRAHPGRPALLTDWGNAALGAGDLGAAALAYKRALHHDRGYDRAAGNLAWVRERMPEWLATGDDAGAIDVLFFWHHRLSVAQRHLGAALAFALAMLLLVPGRRARLRRWLAIAPLLVWVALGASALLEPDASADAVVVADGVTLRSADSAGAPPALASPVPAGAEARVLEDRDGWVRVRLGPGAEGWLRDASVTRVVDE